jgi:hypothetical protein
MEYLMTYGWAILIIAIGVATLSALGIFNGGSGATNGCSTQPNFSCTNPIYSTNGIIATISQDSGQEYYDSWVFVASAAQELGGDGLPQNMSTANMVNTGELPSSQPETFYFVSNTETTAGGIPTTNIPVGTQFTGSIWLAYCTVPDCSSPTGYAKIGEISAKEDGASAGYSLSSSISTSTSSTSTSTSSTTTTSSSTTSIQYVPITLTNTQPSATGANFQQMVQIGVSYTANGEAANLNNIEFTTGPGAAGTPLYAWCESGCTSSSTSIWWVNLSTDTMSAAPGPGNSITIYMNFMPTPIMTTNTAYTGEAPQLYGGSYAQSSYAQYDNGPSVFLYYNVDPTSTAGWTITQSGVGQIGSAPSGSYFGTTNALYTTICQGGASGLFETAIPDLGYNEIITYWTYASSGNDGGNFYFLDSSAQSGPMALFGVLGYGSGLLSSAGPCGYTNPSGPLFSSGTWYKNDIVIAGTTATYYVGANSNKIATLGSMINSVSISSSGDYIGLDTNYDFGSGNGNTYYNGFLIRTYPPNGVMPTVSLSAVQ